MKDAEKEEMSVLDFIGQNSQGQMITIATPDGLNNHIYLQKKSQPVFMLYKIDYFF